MATINERWSALWNRVQGSPARVVRSVNIPSERVHNSGELIGRFNPGQQYFAVYINELFLTHSRQWMSTFDPMAVVVSEFTYAGKPITVPYVVGPSLLTGKVEQIPEGMVFSDTQVAGVHPYNGGKFALSIILAQVRRQSYPQKLLRVIEQTAGSFPLGAAVEAYLKIAGAVLDGVEALFDAGDTKPLAGHRWEFNPGFTDWMTPGFFALIDADENDINFVDLHVQQARLRTGIQSNAPGYRAADYLLYSLRTVSERQDIQELRFYSLFDSALRDAGSVEEGSWERAKAGLVTLYRELITSPDLTWDQAQSLAHIFEERLLKAHEQVKKYRTLGVQTEGNIDAQLTNEEFGGDPRAAERAQMLREVHKLLSL